MRAENFEKRGDFDYGFQEVILQNAPNEFVSDSEDESQVKGHLVDMTVFHDKSLFGNGSITGNVVKFDIDDVVVYDKNGTVYYAKGFLDNHVLYYNATTHRSVE